MSTNKTPNYDLHAWTPQDEFHLTEINENFAALDAGLDRLAEALSGKVEVVTGSYTGDSTASRIIDLGRRPLAVILEISGGYRSQGSLITGGLLTSHMSLGGYAAISDAGFTLSAWNNNYYLNEYSRSYHYIAFFVA